jgi:hypothetical protein
MIATAAPWIYVATLVALVACLYRGHRAGRVNLWELVTARDRAGRDRTDGRKLFETGAFLVMTTAFAYWALVDRLTEWYAGIYVGAFVVARMARDREQRLNRALELGAPAAGETKP